MKKILLLIPSFVLLTSCYQQERNCADFKTGKFRFEYEINGQKKETVFERSETHEVETFEGKTDTSTVRWINDCEYVLQKINPKNAQERKAVHMKILTTKDNSYTFEFSIVGDTKKQKGTVTKIE
ncbi:DNA topoisomerase IV [Flavobacterium sp. Sd200]|uniref:DNA topoisomerase IV n=1 Tax=Flavobacterium sp. Sd200 TaxID=2692211 RepID=UPI00137031B3|nr:DNA topoisomerase IV [Flavobacterium sp. Sd200]MXN90342.1 DNA topoisomerase IV [Flavobacterium sp. Sd200]